MASSSVFAKNLREMRRRAGVSRESIAAYIGVKPKTYDAYEQGRSEPSIKNFVRLLEFFNCEAREMLYGEPAGNVKEELDVLMKFLQIKSIINGEEKTA